MSEHSEPVSTLLNKTRVLLVAGFGGLIVLMAFAGLDTMRVLYEIQNRNTAIQQGYLTRSRILNEIHSEVYLSGTWVRDYLLDPDPETAERQLTRLQQSRQEMDTAIDAYARLLSPADAEPFQSLQGQLERYWKVIEPVMHWDAPHRRAKGFQFFQQELFPRRMAMLGIADRIADINEQQLKEGGAQTAELFRQFRIRLAATLLITFSLGMALALLSVRQILKLERDSSTRYHEIVTARAELKDLSARLVAAQESERRAISRELHDEVGQSLSALRIGLTNLGARIPLNLKHDLETLQQLAETSVGVVRNITLLLRPSMLDDLGLIPALQWQAREVERRSSIAVTVNAGDLPDNFSEEYKTCIYRVVQEALHNIVRHSSATRVNVQLQLNSTNEILLTIDDDGRGFHPDLERGLGLLGMEERVTHLNGTFRVRSEVGKGTSIEISLPPDPELTVESQRSHETRTYSAG